MKLSKKKISELQKRIGNYGKMREIFAQYKASSWDKDFYEQFRTDITIHKTAKKYFNDLGIKKLPSINSLKQEWATLDAERRKLYSGYKASKQKYTALDTAKMNADHPLLAINVSRGTARGEKLTISAV